MKHVGQRKEDSGLLRVVTINVEVDDAHAAEAEVLESNEHRPKYCGGGYLGQGHVPDSCDA